MNSLGVGRPRVGWLNGFSFITSTRAEDARGTPTQSHISLSILVCEENQLAWVRKGFRGGLVFKTHRRVYHSTLGSRIIKMKKARKGGQDPGEEISLGGSGSGSPRVKGPSPPGSRVQEGSARVQGPGGTGPRGGRWPCLARYLTKYTSIRRIYYQAY